ncbi:MAG: 23S rRNA methyltransferase [Coxiella sp. RIFCSPHIGHO2_12_FULL_44_14]|nr:MAG: 23S rRNA methyltransferase [Coxiella sp. RIFCSPHIGHO2_12_FULL_44_14]
MSSSQAWLREHFSDPYVKQAKQQGYPSRAAYKLLEIQAKDHLLKSGHVVVDLGAAPGGWSYVAREHVGSQGVVIAVDQQPMTSLAGMYFLQGDLNDPTLLDQLKQAVKERSGRSTVDLVISDMAPNISGEKSIDQPRSLHLVELAWDCARQLLKPRGVFLAKAFQGSGLDDLIAELRLHFEHVKLRKPQSSRSRSSEVYILGNGFLGYNQ